MTSRTDVNGTMNFVHDSDGRMVASYTDILDQNEYRYDALGRRIYTRKPSQVPVEYTFDGQDVMLTSLGGSLTKFQNGPGIDNKLGFRSGTGTPSYFLSDHLGTTTGTVTPTGGFSPRAALDSFGNVEGDFTGREYDSFNGLYYYRARMYDPKLGRFISEDPIGFEGGDVNLYGYVWNSPIKHIDPMGTLGWCRDGDGTPIPCGFSWGMLGHEPLLTDRSSYQAGWRAQAANFPNGDSQGGADPYGGAYRHCVATCYLGRRYGPFGVVATWVWDLVNEDRNDENSRSDMIGEAAGEGACPRKGSCESECLKVYPNE